MDKDLIAKVSGKADVYLHNHLANSAYWFKRQIEQKIESGKRDGIAFDYLGSSSFKEETGLVGVASTKTGRRSTIFEVYWSARFARKRRRRPCLANGISSRTASSSHLIASTESSLSSGHFGVCGTMRARRSTSPPRSIFGKPTQRADKIRKM